VLFQAEGCRVHSALCTVLLLLMGFGPEQKHWLLAKFLDLLSAAILFESPAAGYLRRTASVGSIQLLFPISKKKEFLGMRSCQPLLLPLDELKLTGTAAVTLARRRGCRCMHLLIACVLQ
jgi:hypothetical protein